MSQLFKDGVNHFYNRARLNRRATKRVEVQFATSVSDSEATITHLAGVRDDGGVWKLTATEVIQSIKRGVVFYVVINRSEYEIVVSKRQNREYIKSSLDRYEPDILLSLPDCP